MTAGCCRSPLLGHASARGRPLPVRTGLHAHTPPLLPLHHAHAFDSAPARFTMTRWTPPRVHRARVCARRIRHYRGLGVGTTPWADGPHVYCCRAHGITFMTRCLELGRLTRFLGLRHFLHAAPRVRTTHAHRTHRTARTTRTPLLPTGRRVADTSPFCRTRAGISRSSAWTPLLPFPELVATPERGIPCVAALLLHRPFADVSATRTWFSHTALLPATVLAHRTRRSVDTGVTVSMDGCTRHAARCHSPVATPTCLVPSRSPHCLRWTPLRFGLDTSLLERGTSAFTVLDIAELLDTHTSCLRTHTVVPHHI